MLLLLVAQGFSLDYNLSSLPVEQELLFNITGMLNSTVPVQYGPYLSGQDELTFDTANKSLAVLLSLPISVGESQMQLPVYVGNATYFTDVNITDDIEFGIALSDGPHYKGIPVAITLTCPDQSIVHLSVQGLSSSEYDLVGCANITYVPAASVAHTVTASFDFHNITSTAIERFNVTRELSCEILAQDSAVQNTTLPFSANVLGSIGTAQYYWTYGTKHSTLPEASFKMEEYGTAAVSLKVSDTTARSATCTKDVDVQELLYDIIIEIADNLTGDPVGDANVTIGSIVKKTNVNGRARFDSMSPGRYYMEVSRQGYTGFEEKIETDSDKTFYFNMSLIPEDEKPYPRIELLHPENNTVSTGGTVTFDFIARSNDDMSVCYVLANYIDHSGYKVKGEISEPQPGKQYSVSADMENGEYKWNVQCENGQGAGTAQDYYFTVSGAATVQKTPQESTVPESVPSTPVPDTHDYSEFDRISEQSTEFKKVVMQSSPDVRAAYDQLGLAGIIEKNTLSAQKLKSDLRELAGLPISEIDRQKKENEIMSGLGQLKKTTPIKLDVIDSYDYEPDTENQDVSIAVEEYLRWREYNLSSSEHKRYIKMVEEAQKSLFVRASLMNVMVTHLDGSSEFFALVSKEVDIDVPGAIVLELVPKSMAQDMDSLTVSTNFELVNADPVFRVYTDVTPQYDYHVGKKVLMDQLKSAQTVAVLDLKHPQNQITGFAIGSETGGKFMLIFILLGIVLTGNYVIFFRTPEQRKKFAQVVFTKPVSGRQKLVSLVDSALDCLQEGDVSAFSYYSQIFDLYESAEPDIKTELKPIMVHLAHELEIYHVNTCIVDAYSLVTNGDLNGARHLYGKIISGLEAIPDKYQDKIDSRFEKVALSLQVFSQDLDDESVNDSLFGVRK